ncbi:hypothetical protein MBAV_004519 [Candidatus Magnetobacterium bavaricum]|uniref:Uncharacterized protein n=1 Tax=Candidatus Magnetobacterium bavaricum TaxID=29290 RepID=A0A0F3GNA7_9BACT|nr:hypothetical protein MBAV_004519 [Candidatus Magnetobacterium bavaricum]
MEQDRKFEEHIRQEKEAMEAFRQEMREKEARSDKIMEAFRQEMREKEARSDKAMEAFRQEMRAIKLDAVEQDRKFEEWIQKDKEEREKEREKERKAFERQINKVSADNAKLLGTLVENIIAPGAKPLIRQYFKCEPIDFRVRADKQRGASNCEVDILIISTDNAFMIEVKSKPDGRDVKKILAKAAILPTFFSECVDKQIIPMLASTFVDDNIIAYATRKGLHVVAYKQWEYLDILNFDAINERNREKDTSLPIDTSS